MLTLKLDGLLNVNTMDSGPLSDQSVPPPILSKSLHDNGSSSQNCNVVCGIVRDTLVYPHIGRLHLSMRPNILFLGPYLQARWS